MTTNAMVIALETPVTDHPVACAIGRRNTGSENMAPNATQPQDAARCHDDPAIARLAHRLLHAVIHTLIGRTEDTHFDTGRR